MHVTPDLLAKYAQGLATSAERHAVETWLAEPTEDPLPDTTWACSPEQQENVRVRIWQRIVRNIDAQPLRFRLDGFNQRWAQGLAAACAVLVVSFVGLGGYTDSQVVDTTNGSVGKTISFNHLKVVVEANSRCRIQRSFFSDATLVQFTGAVSITPETADATSGRVQIEQENNGEPDEFRLRNGQTFLAMTDNVFNLITATTDELDDDIPRPFSSRLSARFNL